MTPPQDHGRSRYDQGGSRGRGGGSGRTTNATTFDPAKPLADLVDTLAEEQAGLMPDGRDALNSSQLRRFFGDVKDLYRRLERGSDYKTQIEPMFKMVRSKASYAWRNGDGRQQKIPRQFYDFIDKGVSKVQNEEHFRAFVQHFEAVVGFIYGTGKVGR